MCWDSAKKMSFFLSIFFFFFFEEGILFFYFSILIHSMLNSILRKRSGYSHACFMLNVLGWVLCVQVTFHLNRIFLVYVRLSLPIFAMRLANSHDPEKYKPTPRYNQESSNNVRSPLCFLEGKTISLIFLW